MCLFVWMFTCLCVFVKCESMRVCAPVFAGVGENECVDVRDRKELLLTNNTNPILLDTPKKTCIRIVSFYTNCFLCPCMTSIGVIYKKQNSPVLHFLAGSQPYRAFAGGAISEQNKTEIRENQVPFENKSLTSPPREPNVTSAGVTRLPWLFFKLDGFAKEVSLIGTSN